MKIYTHSRALEKSDNAIIRNQNAKANAGHVIVYCLNPEEWDFPSFLFFPRCDSFKTRL